MLMPGDSAPIFKVLPPWERGELRGFADMLGFSGGPEELRDRLLWRSEDRTVEFFKKSRTFRWVSGGARAYRVTSSDPMEALDAISSGNGARFVCTSSSAAAINPVDEQGLLEATELPSHTVPPPGTIVGALRAGGTLTAQRVSGYTLASQYTVLGDVPIWRMRLRADLDATRIVRRVYSASAELVAADPAMAVRTLTLDEFASTLSAADAPFVRTLSFTPTIGYLTAMPDQYQRLLVPLFRVPFEVGRSRIIKYFPAFRSPTPSFAEMWARPYRDEVAPL